jgi:hypothetical protein
MLVMFNQGSNETPIHMDLPDDEAKHVGWLSWNAHQPERLPGESKERASVEWCAWFASSPNPATAERRLAVGRAMKLNTGATPTVRATN